MSDAVPPAPTERLASIVAWPVRCIAAEGLNRVPSPLVVAI